MKKIIYFIGMFFCISLNYTQSRADIVAGFQKDQVNQYLLNLKYLYELRSAMVGYSRLQSPAGLQYILAVQDMLTNENIKILNGVNTNDDVLTQVNDFLSNNLFILAQNRHVYVYYLGGNAKQHGAILNDNKWMPYILGGVHGHIKKELKAFFEKTKPYVMNILEDYATESGYQLNQLDYTISGHSMGGGSAPLLAMHLLRTIFEFSPANNLHVFLLGPMPAFDKDMGLLYDEFLKDETLNIIHSNDVEWPCDTHFDPKNPEITSMHIGKYVQARDPINDRHVIDGYRESLKMTAETEFTEGNKSSICADAK